MGKPRVGIVLSEFGIPSEIWALRQAEGFAELEPVYFAATRKADGTALPNGRALHLYGTQAPGFGKRLARKLGLAAGGLPPTAVLARLRAQLLAADLDAVLCHFAWNGVAVQAAIGPALPIICHIHGRDVTANLRWPANRRALIRALPHFARLVTVGSHQQPILQEMWPAAQSALIPCGAPLARFATGPLPERAPDEPVIFVTVGRISDEKGVMQTLAAFEGVCAMGIAARMIFIGDGPRMSDLRAAVAASPAGAQVDLRGLQTPDQIATTLAGAHVYVQHSREVGGWVEGFGVTLTEAGAAGLPLIATRTGGIPDQVLEGKNGLLIAPEDIAAQTSAMAQLARNEPLRLRMGAAAREVARRFDSAGQIAKLEALIIGALR